MGKRRDHTALKQSATFRCAKITPVSVDQCGPDLFFKTRQRLRGGQLGQMAAMRRLEIDPKRTASKNTRMCFMLGSLFTFACPIAFPY